MTKNKKKKSSSKVPHSMLKTSISKAQFDTGCAIARKMIHLLGFDPALFDMFTKKQKHTLLFIETPVPIIRVKNGHNVPRQYVTYVRTSTMNFMRTHYVDEIVQMTYMELVTYGLPFLFATKINYDSGMFTAEQEKKLINAMMQKFTEINLIKEGWFTQLFASLWFDLNFYSQINFRTYGFEFTTDITRPKELLGTAMTIRCIFELTSHENESIHFTHKNIKRKAFGLCVGTTFITTFPPALINHKKLYPESKLTAEYKIYVQSHAIHRFKERVNVVDAPNRNYMINSALIVKQKIVRDAYGHPMISCPLHDVSLGYFPYTIQGDKLFILSFLPVVSSITQEGKKLHDILKLSKDELIYLGMDKLSFFITVDFDEIPILKNALIESGLWQLKQELDDGTPDGDISIDIDKVKTQFIKNFFKKTEDRMQILAEDETITEIETPEEWI
ncbi:MAG: hypothetical protein LBS43_04270 [Prevotellaceae bacterium]|jgi:hypothetical protein|nr:hypothetical protein [Prevotellaceae bacterium]